MDFTEIEVGAGKIVVFEDLTITNEGGGHKIQMDGTDLPYANVTFQTPRTEPETMMLLSPLRMKKEVPLSVFGTGDNGEASKEPERKPFQFDTYTIVVQDIMWDGESAVLRVSKTI